jgi:hypothetical protein
MESSSHRKRARIVPLGLARCCCPAGSRGGGRLHREAGQPRARRRPAPAAAASSSQATHAPGVNAQHGTALTHTTWVGCGGGSQK